MLRFAPLCLLLAALGACSPADDEPAPPPALSAAGQRALVAAAQAQKESQLEHARAVLVEALAAEPDAWRLHLALGQIEAATHRYARALSEAARAEALGAPKKEVLFLRLGVATAWHDLNETLKLTAALGKLPPGSLSADERDRVDRTRIRALRESEKTGAALDVLREGPLRRHPNDFGFRLMEASLNLDLAKNEAASRLLDDLARHRPEDPKLLRLRALALNRLGQLDAVVAIQRQLHARFPQDPVAALELAQALNRTGKPEHLREALTLLESSSRDPRTRLDSAKLRTSLLRRLGRKEEARTEERRLAELKARQTEESDAIRRLLAERRKHPDDAEILGRLTRAWMARGNRKAALKVARDRIRIAPNDAGARRELSRVLLAVGRAEDAWWEIRRASALTEDDPSIHLITAWAAMRTKRWGAAREALRLARKALGPTEEIRRIEQALGNRDRDGMTQH